MEVAMNILSFSQPQDFMVHVLGWEKERIGRYTHVLKNSNTLQRLKAGLDLDLGREFVHSCVSHIARKLYTGIDFHRKQY